jgi:hypothetical protein
MIFKIQFLYVSYDDVSRLIKSEKSFITSANVEVVDNGESYTFTITLDDIGLTKSFGIFYIEKSKDTGHWMIDGTKGLDFVTLQYSVISKIMQAGY